MNNNWVICKGDSVSNTYRPIMFDISNISRIEFYTKALQKHGDPGMVYDIVFVTKQHQPGGMHDCIVERYYSPDERRDRMTELYNIIHGLKNDSEEGVDQQLD